MRTMFVFRKMRGLSLFLTIFFVFACSGGGDGSDDSDPLSREDNDSAASEDTALAVVSASPSNGSLGVQTDTQIDITFNNAIDPCTININTFTVSVNRVSIPGDICINDNILTFYPRHLLSNGETYTLKLSTGVKDLDGNPLPLDFIATFTTANTDQMTL